MNFCTPKSISCGRELVDILWHIVLSQLKGENVHDATKVTDFSLFEVVMIYLYNVANLQSVDYMSFIYELLPQLSALSCKHTWFSALLEGHCEPQHLTSFHNNFGSILKTRKQLPLMGQRNLLIMTAVWMLQWCARILALCCKCLKNRSMMNAAGFLSNFYNFST